MYSEGFAHYNIEFRPFRRSTKRTLERNVCGQQRSHPQQWENQSSRANQSCVSFPKNPFTKMLQ
jgi:hypothetical protein